jgi:hypothetical protein
MLQYNSLITKASASNFYAYDWSGPPPISLDISGATSSMGAFALAVAVANDPSSYTCVL